MVQYNIDNYRMKDGVNMELHEKLQELRRQNGITQEELAEKLYVSRTAISKWESGRGYPSIESLKAIAKYFSVSVDELLSSNELLTVAYEDKKRFKHNFCDVLFDLVDICALLLLFLPLFAEKSGQNIIATSLLKLSGVQLYIKITFFVVIIATFLLGVVMLTLQGLQLRSLSKYRNIPSLMLGGVVLLLFIVAKQPYAAILSFVLLTIKTIFFKKRS